MALSLTDAQLQTIADKPFLFQPTASVEPKNTTGADSLAAALDPIGSDPRFAHTALASSIFHEERLCSSHLAS